MSCLEIPNIFWKYYDLFRRKKITLDEFCAITSLTKEQIEAFLREI